MFARLSVGKKNKKIKYKFYSRQEEEKKNITRNKNNDLEMKYYSMDLDKITTHCF